MPKIAYRWIIAIVLFAAYSIQYLDRVKTSVLNPLIAKDLGLTTTDIGNGVFLMLMFYGPAQLLSGFLADRFGAKRILIFSIFAWSAMTAWMGLIESRDEYFIRMAFFGALIGTEYVPSARILMRWFNKKGRARAQALMSWAWILTPAWGTILATELAQYEESWRIVFFITAALGMFPLLLIMVVVHDRPEQYAKITRDDLDYAYADEVASGVLMAGEYGNANKAIMANNPVHFSDFFKERSYLALIFCNITLVIIMYSVINWIPLYLTDVFHFNLTTMGRWSALYFIAGAIGSFLSSYLSDKVFNGNRRIMIIACFIGLIPFLLLLSTLKIDDPLWLAVALCGMGFFGNMGWGPLTSVPADLFSPEVYGKAMGFVNAASYMVTGFSAKIFSALVIETDQGKDYTHGWYFIALCVTVGVIASTFIRSNRTAIAAQPAALSAA